MKYYLCKKCGNIIEIVNDKCNSLTCCGEKVLELIPGVVDAAEEKHVPAYTIDNDVVKVEVGSILHPMLDNHYIEFIALETKKGYQRVTLKPNDEPKATFKINPNDEIVAIYEYCNLHGLWKNK